MIARLGDNSWSAPSAICTFGLSWGFVAGLDVTDYVIILNTTEAVQAFSGSGQLTIGAGIEVAVGPVGRWVMMKCFLRRCFVSVHHLSFV